MATSPIPAAKSAPKRGGLVAAFPLLTLPVAAYNAAVVATSPTEAAVSLATKLFGVPMASGGRWDVDLGDLLVFGALVVLFVELLKSTTSRGAAIVNHALSLMLLIVCLIEFLLLRAFATSTFFLITVMVLLDVLAGFIVTIVASRRDFGVATE